MAISLNFNSIVLFIEQLLEDPASYLHDFVVAPGNMLSGRGSVMVYLNNMNFRVTEGKFATLILTHYLLNNAAILISLSLFLNFDLFLVFFHKVSCCNFKHCEFKYWSMVSEGITLFIF